MSQQDYEKPMINIYFHPLNHLEYKIPRNESQFTRNKIFIQLVKKFQI